MIARQLSLFESDAPRFDEAFGRAQRRELGDDAWVEHIPGWLSGHWQMFEHLERGTRWRKEQREMYERVVDVPRLYGILPEDGPGHPLLVRIQAALSRHYGEAFARIGLAFYRDGRDSVAWHGDYVARKLPNALVATLSVGASRKFLLRPAGGGRSLAYQLGEGDLFVMGGSCQRTWQHHVPKVARAEPRISIMFRPIWEEPSP